MCCAGVDLWGCYGDMQRRNATLPMPMPCRTATLTHTHTVFAQCVPPSVVRSIFLPWQSHQIAAKPSLAYSFTIHNGSKEPETSARLHTGFKFSLESETMHCYSSLGQSVYMLSWAFKSLKGCTQFRMTMIEENKTTWARKRSHVCMTNQNLPKRTKIVFFFFFQKLGRFEIYR